MNRKSYIILAVAVIAFGAAVFWGREWLGSGVARSTIPGWKTYEHQFYGFSVQYPPDYEYVEAAYTDRAVLSIGFGKLPHAGPAFDYIIEVRNSTLENERNLMRLLPEFREETYETDRGAITILSYVRPDDPDRSDDASGLYEVAVIPHGDRVLLISATSPDAIEVFRAAVATLKPLAAE